MRVAYRQDYSNSARLHNVVEQELQAPQPSKKLLDWGVPGRKRVALQLFFLFLWEYPNPKKFAI